MKNTLHILILFIASNYFGQTITPQVINSAGGNWTLPSGITISDNIGEPFVTTVSNGNNIITQGFLQNFILVNTFSVSIIKNDVSCKDKKDGNISVAFTSNIPSTSLQYTWEPQAVCPLNNCNTVDSLKPGTYTVSVKITYTVGINQRDTLIKNTVVINDLNGPCKVIIYNGVTPNSDGINDVFTIENINEFPNNRVSIYNRWGRLLYDERGYDNITKFWPRRDEGSNLQATTYFYVLDLGDGSELIKNWIEILKD